MKPDKKERLKAIIKEYMSFSSTSTTTNNGGTPLTFKGSKGQDITLMQAATDPNERSYILQQIKNFKRDINRI